MKGRQMNEMAGEWEGGEWRADACEGGRLGMREGGGQWEGGRVVGSGKAGEW